jgi:hypothetical protein
VGDQPRTGRGNGGSVHDNIMTSPRTSKSQSPLDTAPNRSLLASIKRQLRRIQRSIKATDPAHKSSLK